jgi:hypothetical protein
VSNQRLFFWQWKTRPDLNSPKEMVRHYHQSNRRQWMYPNADGRDPFVPWPDVVLLLLVLESRQVCDQAVYPPLHESSWLCGWGKKFGPHNASSGRSSRMIARFDAKREGGP